MRGLPSRTEAADELREQAASCRRLALGARTSSGSEALRTVALEFDSDAERIDPVAVSVASDASGDADGAALVRVRLALQHQMRNGFGIGRR